MQRKFLTGPHAAHNDTAKPLTTAEQLAGNVVTPNPPAQTAPPIEVVHISDFTEIVSSFLHLGEEVKALKNKTTDLVALFIKSRGFIDKFPSMSANVAYEVNYYDYRFLFLYSLTAFTLALNTGGTVPVPANAWVAINFPRGTKLTAQGVSDQAAIMVQIRACDELLALQETGSVSLLAGNANVGNVGFTSDYPAGSIPVSNSSGNVANAAATATLPGTAGKTTYITGFEVTGAGATAALVVIVTVTGLTGGTLSYIYAAVAGVAVENTPLFVQFTHPIPANAQNTAIAVSCPALGAGNTNNAVSAHGYQL